MYLLGCHVEANGGTPHSCWEGVHSKFIEYLISARCFKYCFYVRSIHVSLLERVYSHVSGEPKNQATVRTAHSGLTRADTSHTLCGRDSQYTTDTVQCAVRDASRGSWLVHVGSNLGIIPTMVRPTLGILQNMCATHVKY